MILNFNKRCVIRYNYHMSLTFYHDIDLLSTRDYHAEKYFFNYMIAMFTVAIDVIICKNTPRLFKSKCVNSENRNKFL